MKNKILAIVAVGMLVGPMAARAIPVTLSDGETATFNFDLTSVTPAPPYFIVWFGVVISDSSLSGSISFDVFLEPNGENFYTGVRGIDPVNGDLLLMGIGGHPGIDDMIFSVQFSALNGAAFTIDPYVFGTSDFSFTSTVTDRIFPVSTSVPEPGTLAMLGLGLAGLGFTRRKKLS